MMICGSCFLHSCIFVHLLNSIPPPLPMCFYSKAELSLADALKLVQRRRPEAQPIPAFMQFLERFEQQCQEFSTTRPTKRPRIGPTIGPPTSCPPPPTSTTATAKGSIGPSIGPVHPTAPSLSEETTIGPIRPQTSDVTAKKTTTSSSKGSIGPVRPTVPFLSEETTIGPVQPQSSDATTTTTSTTTNVTTMPLTGERTGITRDDKNLDGSDEDDRSTVIGVNENPDIGPSPQPTTHSSDSNYGIGRGE